MYTVQFVAFNIKEINTEDTIKKKISMVYVVKCWLGLKSTFVLNTFSTAAVLLS